MLLNLNFLKKSFDCIDSDWKQMLCNDFFVDLLNKIDLKLINLSKEQIIYPSNNLIFNAFKYTKFVDTSVVIIGQDPYHGDKEANGLAFDVDDFVKMPPSLKNIIQEISIEYNVNKSQLSPNLLKLWAKQGVLLLNSTLTVIKDRPNSLSHIGWDLITDEIIKYISYIKSNIVFMLWGNYAKKKSILIDQNKHKILYSAHPSPLSAYRGFLGSNHFKLANEYLISNCKKAIKWDIRKS